MLTPVTTNDDPDEVEQAPENTALEMTNTSNDTEEKTKLKRKKIAVPEEWSRNKLKRNIQCGQEHKSMSSDKVILAKRALLKDCSKCPRKCNTNFDEEERNVLNKEYWKLGNIDLQRHYLSGLIDEKNKSTTRTASISSRRQKTRFFYLVKNNEKIQVCQGFFLATYNISNTVVQNIIRKRNDQNIVEKDKRGKHPPGIKLPENSKKVICDHINSYERVPSHYTRKDTSKEYLPGDLNLIKMYDMYVEKCREEKLKPEKLWFYRQVFNTNFNIAFHIPRKDLCDTCFIYKNNNLNDEEKITRSEEYEKHLQRKENARECKNIFKDKAIKNEHHFCEFDFEAVRYCPQIKTKAIFYKSRFAVLNLTVYNVASRRAENYVWHEALCGRGASEVASCLFKYMQLNQDGKPFSFMSDTCGGQNRNVIVCAMFLYAVEVFQIPTIDHIFFEPGHSQMECDSVHAHIEKSSRDLEIYDPSGWYTAIRMASKQNKYVVTEISQSDILDFKEFAAKIVKNRKIDCEGNNVRWLDIIWFQYRKNDTEHIYFKYDFNARDFYKFKIQRRPMRLFDLKNVELKQKYNGPIPIDKKKLTGLHELCRKGIIKEQYHFFYYSLQEGHQNEDDDNEDA